MRLFRRCGWLSLLLLLLPSVLLQACGDDGASADRAASCPALAVCADAGDGADDAGDDTDAAGEAADAAAVATDAAGGEAATDALLWTPDTLAQAVAAGEVLALDVRAEADFIEAHATSATGLPETRLRATVDGVPGQLPPTGEVAELIGLAGVATGTPVVVYGQVSDLAAARVFWTLSYLGHPAVHLLDGGFSRYEAEGHTTESGEQRIAPAEFPDDRIVSTLRVDVEWVLSHLDDPDVVLLDARSPSEYEAGHIPGALSFNWQDNVEGGRLRSREALERRHAEVPRDATVVAYCQTGSRAAMAWFVLIYLGFEDARLYDGSMAEWAMDDTRPLQTGP